MNETDMGQNLFDVLLENRKVFVVPKEEMEEEDNSMEAQSNRMLDEMYAPILERFSEGELDYIINDLIPDEMKKFRNEKMKDQGYKI